VPRDGVALGVGIAKGVSRRRGDYRAVYRIDDQRHLVTIVAIELAPTCTARDNNGRDGRVLDSPAALVLVTGAGNAGCAPLSREAVGLAG
jgi:hypothetical protein